MIQPISIPLDLLLITLAGHSLLVSSDDMELIRERIAICTVEGLSESDAEQVALADHQRGLEG